MKPATIRDVAKMAGVGVGTVSRVLNQHPSVREGTRQRVEAAIATLNYSPSPIARQLSKGRSSSIAVVAPFFIRPSSVERLRGVETVLAERGFNLVLYNVETQKRRDELFAQIRGMTQFEGILILSLSPTDEDAALLQAVARPVVLIDAEHPRLPRVMIDDVEGGRMATRYLIELGHRRIAYISDILENAYGSTAASIRRYAGYRQALEEAGIAYRSEYFLQDYHGVRQAQVLTHRLLSLPERPTAIFAASDTQSIGILRAAQEESLSIPNDLSVIGFDDIETAEYFNLTTIHQPLFTSGVEGAELLFKMIDSPAPTRHAPVEIKLPLRLIERQSTAPPANKTRHAFSAQADIS